MNVFDFPFWVWTSFFFIVIAALLVDIAVVNRRSHVPTKRETLVWSIVWVSLAAAFNIFIYYVVSRQAGHDAGLFKAKEFLTGYLIELSLSIDNLFVFLLIFNFFSVPRKYQHRVLFWGIMGAMFMRMGMIFAGAELVERFHWIIYIFGAFLVYTGIKLFDTDEDLFDPEDSRVVSLVTRYVRIKKSYVADKFVIMENGKRVGTLLLLVLIVVELSDVIFAVDSIPAIFGVTVDRFIIYTSNIFAILGLRTFFFLLADLADRFRFLQYGLAFVLSFIGVKMLLPIAAEGWILVTGNEGPFSLFVHRFLKGDFDQSLINISLAVVAGTILLSIILSAVIPPARESGESKIAETPDGEA